MGRTLRLRRRGGAIPDFEAALAHLSEELVLTEAFTELMLRDGNLEAAAAAVDEQRERLHAAEAVMLSSLRPRSRRLQVAVAGVAAVMMLGTGAVAALRALSPERAQAHAAIQRLEEGLERVEAASTTAQANRIAVSALTEFTKLGDDELDNNPGVSGALLQLLNEQIAKLETGKLPSWLTERLRRERNRVRKHLEPVPVPPPSPSPAPEPPPQEPPPQEPPSTPNPVSS